MVLIIIFKLAIITIIFHSPFYLNLIYQYHQIWQMDHKFRPF